MQESRCLGDYPAVDSAGRRPPCFSWRGGLFLGNAVQVRGTDITIPARRELCTQARLTVNHNVCECDLMKPTKDTAMSFRLPADLKAELQRRADAEQRSLAQYVTLVLQAHVADPMLPPPSPAFQRAAKISKSRKS
jgi:hypothetical protein